MMGISTAFYKLCHYSKPPLYLLRSSSYYTCVICGRRCEIAIRKRNPFDFIMRMVKAGIEQTSKCIPSTSLPPRVKLYEDWIEEERQRNICRKKEELIRKVLCRTYRRRIGGGQRGAQKIKENRPAEGVWCVGGCYGGRYLQEKIVGAVNLTSICTWFSGGLREEWVMKEGWK